MARRTRRSQEGVRLLLRLTKDEEMRIKAIAATLHMDPTNFMRSQILQRVDEIAKAYGLSAEDLLALVEGSES
jgi:uncharacterized protein (DUF1778 family)